MECVSKKILSVFRLMAIRDFFNILRIKSEAISYAINKSEHFICAYSLHEVSSYFSNICLTSYDSYCLVNKLYNNSLTIYRERVE